MTITEVAIPVDANILCGRAMTHSIRPFSAKYSLIRLSIRFHVLPLVMMPTARPSSDRRSAISALNTQSELVALDMEGIRV